MQNDKEVIPTSSPEASNPLQEQTVPGLGLIPTILLGFATAASCLAAYHFAFGAKQNTKFAVIDIQTISSELESEARKVIVDKVDATEDERKTAAASYEAKMRNLQGVLNQIGEECKCVLIIKAAVLNNKSNEKNHIVDYTNTARQKIGLSAIENKTESK